MTLTPEQHRTYFEARLNGQPIVATGRDVSVRCPFHDDRQASLSIHADKGLWKCFAGCGAGGVLEFASTSKGGSLARRRYQKGSVILYGDVWYGKFRDDIIGADGKTVRVQRRVRLGKKKEYPTKRLAERRLEQELFRINATEYRPGRVATVAEFAER